MASSAAAPISIDCLADSDKEEEIKWKRFLFYLLAYCDTFHDFSSGRDKLSSTEIPGRPEFTLKLIDHMDPAFKFRNYYQKIQGIIKQTGDSSYEHAMYNAFTQLTNNPLIEIIPDGLAQYKDPIKAHLISAFGAKDDTANIYEMIDSDVFTSDMYNPTGSIIDFYLPKPKLLYEPEFQRYFINAVRRIYADNIEDDALKFVEDSGSFPREFFINQPDNYRAFVKMNTIQTYWDPGGYSKYIQEKVTEGIFQAPSFITLNPFSDNGDEFMVENGNFNSRNTTVNYNEKSIRINKPGPSVPHLFLHMAHASPDTPLALKTKIELLIKKEQIGSKNISLPLDKTAKPFQEKLREYATLKRSGDYELVHSAIHTDALTIGTDLPEFIYAAMNKRAYMYHARSVRHHHFRFYVPPPRSGVQRERLALEREIATLLMRANELSKIFGVFDTFIIEFFGNVLYILTNRITVKGDPLTGELFKHIISKELLSLRSFIDQMKLANLTWKVIDDKNIPFLLSSLKAPLETVKIISIPDGITRLEELPELVQIKNEVIPGFSDLIKENDNLLSETLKELPRAYQKTPTSINPLNATLFIPVKDNQTGTFIVREGSNYKEHIIKSVGLFPQFNALNTNISVISRNIELAKQNASDQRKPLRIKNINAIIDNLSALEIDEAIISLFRRDTLPTYDEIPTTNIDSMIGYIEESIVDINKKTPLVEVIEGLGIQVAAAAPAAANAAPAAANPDPAANAAEGGARRNKVTPRRRTPRNRRTSETPVSPTEIVETKELSLVEKHALLHKIFDTIDVPFGLTGSQYANCIMERIIILESINELLAKNPPKVSTEITPAKEILEKEVHTGGARLLPNIQEVCCILYWETIEPFFKKYYIDKSADSIYESCLLSIINESFIDDLINLLQEITLLSNEEIEDGKFNKMVTNAGTALNNIIDVFTMGGDNIIYFSERNHQPSNETIVGIIRRYSEFQRSFDSVFLDNINTIIVHLSSLFRIRSKTPADNAITNAKIDKTLNLINDNNIDEDTSIILYKQCVHLIAANYFTSEITVAPAAAAAAANPADAAAGVPDPHKDQLNLLGLSRGNDLPPANAPNVSVDPEGDALIKALDEFFLELNTAQDAAEQSETPGELELEYIRENPLEGSNGAAETNAAATSSGAATSTGVTETEGGFSRSRTRNRRYRKRQGSPRRRSLRRK